MKNKLLSNYLPFLFLWIAVFILFGCKPNKNIISTYESKALLDSTFNVQWQNQTNFIAGQNAFSLLLENGKILWLYRQSHINDLVNNKIPCQPNVQNAAVLQSAGTFQLLNIGASDYIPVIATNPFIPMCAYVYTDTIFIFGKDSTNTNSIYIAKFLYPSLQYIGTVPLSLPSIVPSTFQFGFACVADSVTGYYFNYGIRKQNGQYQIAVARHPLDNPFKTWRFWNGTDWKNNTDDAAVIFSTIAEPTCIRKLNGAYICINQNTGNGCGAGSQITFKYSSYPIGPFEGDKKLFTIPNQWQGFLPNAFGASMQPSIIGSTFEKRVLFTYSLNGYQPCTNDCDAGFTNPEFYKTYGFSVPLQSFNPGW
jgi:hypothetical protein